MEVTSYTAIVERGDRWWVVRVPGLGNNPDEGLPTQARNLAEVEPMTRDLIATWLDTAPDSFELDVQVRLPAKVLDHLRLAERHAEDAARAQSEAASERRVAARELKEAGLTVRDIGAALGVSFQRAQQLISAAS